MSESLPTLLSKEKLRALTVRALDILYECQDIDPFGDDDEEYERSSRCLRSAMEAVRFCASAAALHRDTSLLPLLVKVIEILDWYNDDAYSATYELARVCASWKVFAKSPAIRGLFINALTISAPGPCHSYAPGFAPKPWDSRKQPTSCSPSTAYTAGLST